MHSSKREKRCLFRLYFRKNSNVPYFYVVKLQRVNVQSNITSFVCNQILSKRRLIQPVLQWVALTLDNYFLIRCIAFQCYQGPVRRLYCFKLRWSVISCLSFKKRLQCCFSKCSYHNNIRQLEDRNNHQFIMFWSQTKVLFVNDAALISISITSE